MADTKLLLVEDDENLAYMEKSCFEDIIGGYEVKTAVNGKEGLKVWQDFQPDVIVSDIDMPIMDGIEMVKKSEQDLIPVLDVEEKGIQGNSVLFAGLFFILAGVMLSIFKGFRG